MPSRLPRLRRADAGDDDVVARAVDLFRGCDRIGGRRRCCGRIASPSLRPGATRRGQAKHRYRAEQYRTNYRRRIVAHQTSPQCSRAIQRRPIDLIKLVILFAATSVNRGSFDRMIFCGGPSDSSRTLPPVVEWPRKEMNHLKSNPTLAVPSSAIFAKQSNGMRACPLLRPCRRYVVRPADTTRAGPYRRSATISARRRSQRVRGPRPSSPPRAPVS